MPSTTTPATFLQLTADPMAAAAPQPETIRDRRGAYCRRATSDSYPLTARCALCFYRISCADGTADWTHLHSLRCQSDPTTLRTVCADPDERDLCAICVDEGGHVIHPDRWSRGGADSSRFVFVHGGDLKLVQITGAGFIAQIVGTYLPDATVDGLFTTAQNAYDAARPLVALVARLEGDEGSVASPNVEPGTENDDHAPGGRRD